MRGEGNKEKKEKMKVDKKDGVEVKIMKCFTGCRRIKKSVEMRFKECPKRCSVLMVVRRDIEKMVYHRQGSQNATSVSKTLDPAPDSSVRPVVPGGEVDGDIVGGQTHSPCHCHYPFAIRTHNAVVAAVVDDDTGNPAVDGYTRVVVAGSDGIVDGKRSNRADPALVVAVETNK